PPTAERQAPTPTEQPLVFRESVEEVTAPVLVFDQDGEYVNGLQPYQFHLFDNDKEQNIQVDVSYLPISLAIVLQVNAHVEGILPQLRKIGALIQPLLIGDQGEAAVIGFDSRIRVLQDWTTDADKITKAVKDIYAGSNSSRMIDAIAEATRMLRRRPPHRRRIILYIGETRDVASETRLREALLALQYANILFYPVDMSRLFSTLTAKPDPGRQHNLPPAMYPLPSNVPATPTTVQQTYGYGGGNRAEFVPMMVEVFKDVKAIFKDNPVEAFTKGTGGTEYSFFRQRGLEEAIQKIGAELHSQYMVTYRPNNKDEGGFHKIQVAISNAPQVKKTQTRPGYWLGVKQ
ncbi:MAG: VWA domain-containing protein, partial [Acidobacteria bacterium]|nr:VWA domain-containing protein [Acidobacteriota bacterium]